MTSTANPNCSPMMHQKANINHSPRVSLTNSKLCNEKIIMNSIGQNPDDALSPSRRVTKNLAAHTSEIGTISNDRFVPWLPFRTFVLIPRPAGFGSTTYVIGVERSASLFFGATIGSCAWQQKMKFSFFKYLSVT